jgi:hypothetical protein
MDVLAREPSVMNRESNGPSRSQYAGTSEGASVIFAERFVLASHPRPSQFTSAEIQAMHGWCCVYRDFVRVDGVPTAEQDALFMIYHRLVYLGGADDE